MHYKYNNFREILNNLYNEEFNNENSFSDINITKAKIDFNKENSQIIINKETSKIVKFEDIEPIVEFTIRKIENNEYELLSNIYKYELYEFDKNIYLIENDILYKLSEKFIQRFIGILKVFKLNLKNKILFSNNEIPMFFSLIYPKIKENLTFLNTDIQDLKKYKSENLISKLYLDFDANGNILAQIKFNYNEEEFNPLETNIEKKNRDIVLEARKLELLRKSGFMLYKDASFILTEEDKIYRFLNKSFQKYSDEFEIFATDNFSKKQVRYQKTVSIGVKLENNLLDVDLSYIDFDTEELKEIIKKYTTKKKYHRLKDGRFIDLEDNKEIEFLNNIMLGGDFSYKDIIDNHVYLPINRSVYLSRIIKENSNIEFNYDNEFEEIINKLESNDENIDLIPESLENVLRFYQKTGYKWLKNLDEYKLGGILADDMGLGKTIQVLSLLLSYKENKSIKNKKTSIVICPSSLALNWKNEIEKFAPNLKTILIKGSLEERKEEIKNIKDYDLVITSYDLLKRDIQLYINLNYNFKYIIADEAQYIKNNNTKNARAIKDIIAETRYALTGTPIENSLAELWSIFDYIMPGYLFSYKKFKREFELPIVRDNNKEAMDKLKKLIEPFILRRTKSEVLKELPEKTITILNNEMTKEQSNVYKYYLAQAKNEIIDEIEENGFNKSRIKILALLTRLRQICCHPSLFLNNYKEDSGKLNQCIEIVRDGISSGHKILVFSGYTSMLDIIEKELIKDSIKYYKLTGQTKLDERIDLVENFNKNDDIKLFLISLKAGGTGINLTSADMVIHYDPWWNISVENQATDRTHRIGQKKKVQVYKLITKNSIEEKIYDLQKRKEELIDNMLSTDTKFISKLSKEDIMRLFE